MRRRSPPTRISWGHALGEISTVPGQEAGLQIIVRPPGGSATPHYHPDGHEWVYCASGRRMSCISGVT